VYQFSNNAWTQLGADLDGEAAGDNFGETIALSSDGSIVAVGGNLNDGSGADAGHARVYHFSNNAWTQLGADLDGEVAGDNFGGSIALSSDGSTVAVGGNQNDGSGADAGHARSFNRVDCTVDCITAVSSPIVLKDSTPSLSFIGAFPSPDSYIGVALSTGGCGSPSSTFQYATAPSTISAVSTADNYVLCYSMDGGTTYLEQTTFGDAFVVSCPAGFKGSACDVEATTFLIEDDAGTIFFGDDDAVALYAQAGELSATSGLSAGTVTTSSLVVNEVDVVAKLADLQNRLQTLQAQQLG
jgi:hypothetical protein